jgi:hypothetical protein
MKDYGIEYGAGVRLVAVSFLAHERSPKVPSIAKQIGIWIHSLRVSTRSSAHAGSIWRMLDTSYSPFIIRSSTRRLSWLATENVGFQFFSLPPQDVAIALRCATELAGNEG